MPNIQGGGTPFGGGSVGPGFISSQGGANSNTDMILLIMQALSKVGGSLDPQGPAGAMDQQAQRWIQNQSYMNMMKQMMGNEALSNMTLADTAGLTPEHMSNIMKTMLGQREIDQKGLSDAYDAAYKTGTLSNQTRLINAQVGELTPSINVPGTNIKLTNKEYVDWYKAASKDERTTTLKEYEYAQKQGYEGSFESWAKEMKKAGASIFNLGEAVDKAEALGKVKQGLKLSDPGYIPSVVSELKKDSYAWDDSLAPYKERWKAQGITGAEADRLAEKAYVMDDITRRLAIRYGKDNVSVDVVNDEIIWKVNGKVVQRY
jgi:hypothetical protein